MASCNSLGLIYITVFVDLQAQVPNSLITNQLHEWLAKKNSSAKHNTLEILTAKKNSLAKHNTARNIDGQKKVGKT